MNGIGWAVKQLEHGYRVCRAGWNGKDMWLSLVPAAAWDHGLPTVSQGGLDRPHRLPWVGMKTADNGFVPWLCSQTDLLATDWELAP